MTDQKPKKVVIFSANGGIGEATAQALAEQMNLPENRNQPVEVHLLARAGAKGENQAKGIAIELRDAESLKSYVDLKKAFNPAHAYIWDAKNIASAEAALKDADVIILPGGMPRKDGQTRADLIDANMEMLKPMAQAIATYAPVRSPIVTCTNPLDNMVNGIEEICHRVWDQRSVPAQDRPEYKAVGMGGTLDEARFKIALADRLSFLKNETILPIDIEAVIYGQHGPTMSVDRDTIKVKGKSLGELGIGAVALNSLLSDAEKETREKGAEILKLLGRTSQEPPATRIAEIAAAFLFGNGKPHVLTASVKHQIEGEKSAIASGCQIEVSPTNIKRVPYNCSDVTMAAIEKSRAEILKDQTAYELGGDNGKKLISLLAANDYKGITSETKPGSDTVTVKLSAGFRKSNASLGDDVKLLKNTLRLAENPISMPGSPSTIEFTLNPEQLRMFDRLVAAANKAITPASLSVA